MRPESPSLPGACGAPAQRYFLALPEISAAVALALGGAFAVSGGECAPDASSGLAAGDAYGPGSAQGAVDAAGNVGLPDDIATDRYFAATRSCAWQS
jgi:hypothetical protein